MSPTPETLTAAARGDRAACRQILADCGPVVWALCRRLATDADDAYQDVWVHVFERIDRFDPRGPAAFTTWLHRVAHNKLLDRHRRQARGRQLFVVEEPPELPSRAPLSRLALDDLPPEEAAVLRARIDREPELADAWAVMSALPDALSDLVEPPPSALQAAVLERVAPPAVSEAAPVEAVPGGRGAGWRVAVAIAAGLLVGWMFQPAPDRAVVTLQPGGSQVVLGHVDVVAGDVRVAVDGEARISWEPEASLARVTPRNPREQGGDVRQGALGAGLGAVVAVAVMQGMARVDAEPDGALVVEQGEDVRVAARTAKAAPAAGAVASLDGMPSTAGLSSQEAALQAEVERLTMENELLRGQLELVEGVEQRWPDDVPAVFQEHGVRAGFEQAVGERGEVLTVNCDEYPCIAFADFDPSMGTFETHTDALKAGLAQTHSMEVEAFYVANLEHEDGREVQIAGLAFYPPDAQPDDAAWDRTHARARAGLEDLMEDHPVMQGD